MEVAGGVVEFFALTCLAPSPAGGRGLGQSEPDGDRRGPRADELTLTPLVLIERIAALVVNSIALITHSADTGQMLNHIGVQAEPQN